MIKLHQMSLISGLSLPLLPFLPYTISDGGRGDVVAFTTCVDKGEQASWQCSQSP
jgi:hypothetical protein